MSDPEQRAFVRDWNLAHGWRGEMIDQGHMAMILCVERAIERSMHRTGAKEYLEYEQSR